MTKAPRIEYQFSIESDQWDDEAVQRPIVEEMIAGTLDWLSAHEGHVFSNEASELSLLMTDDASIQSINAQWRDLDKATNVLSFPSTAVAIGDIPAPILGDLVFAYETIEREAAELDKPFDHHFRHLIVHGFLHLLGYDHLSDDEAVKMESIETSILATFGLSNPYEDAR